MPVSRHGFMYNFYSSKPGANILESSTPVNSTDGPKHGPKYKNPFSNAWMRWKTLNNLGQSKSCSELLTCSLYFNTFQFFVGSREHLNNYLIVVWVPYDLYK